ncbi:hypothetical protein MTR67_044458 [Solanum verrucosum]|uniref:Uncharacterized protein n=1 Tax=Solanum verrucosum TaxID=315347 RepID=A0AAF0UTG6_SOLVR|nr:hypothetical protein MTR67_044458 [Solanum verrucosum]
MYHQYSPYVMVIGLVELSQVSYSVSSRFPSSLCCLVFQLAYSYIPCTDASWPASFDDADSGTPDQHFVSAELRKPGQGFAWGQKWSPGAGPVQGVGSGRDNSIL